MRRRALALWSALLLGTALAGCGFAAQSVIDAIDNAGGGGGGGGGDPGTMSASELALATEVYVLVNEERDAQGLPPLLWHDTMADVAYDHAVDMDVRDFFDHVNPDGDGPGDRLLARGVTWTVVAENIAQGPTTAADVMDLWMNSDGHRANILSPLLTEIGIGVHQTAQDTWWVQDFRTP